MNKISKKMYSSSLDKNKYDNNDTESQDNQSNSEANLDKIHDLNIS